ncbi:ATPase, YjeE family [secondary endosymbiont of Heteropsylla cubana]|uniref:tRNA threonylcarbamoyladenosine biosynthesis protein TsaE n=1 Tax=secondary endosymbiont of Heteropsylla cubana TaxID=134287 RepID=J3VTZ6_9ENTR|nr:tRNA (adenosine(37)-N6)-threonylcarbamoyltransferase complex ATPase subunit type 1 TsaE [secondary endosymbiont of Heteropsylla cubana]AFP85541.1 ATPase, YjeE family [secondary endosymbiont of Heteropsylla cubana]
MIKYIISLSNEKTTMRLGSAVAYSCQTTCSGCVIYLYGDLGSGKTTFCRGFLRALGHVGNVKSPTYTLIEPYTLLHWTVYHCDLYRLTTPEELDFLGIRDYFNHTALWLIEWPQRGNNNLPMADISITLQYYKNERQAETNALTSIGMQILTRLGPLKETLA